MNGKKKETLLMWKCKEECGGKPCYVIYIGRPLETSDPEKCPWGDKKNPKWILVEGGGFEAR
ncbi:MAG: hypothetical protein QXU09_04450 [Thermoproteota archaeon]